MKVQQALHQRGLTPQKGVQVRYRWETRSRTKILFVDYSITLDEGLARSLSILREGAESGALAERGKREKLTGMSILMTTFGFNQLIQSTLRLPVGRSCFMCLGDYRRAPESRAGW